jgi:hypothetical protein
MRIPPPNPLTTVCTWIAAIFIAIRAGAETAGALNLVRAMSGGWSYLPIGVLTLAAAVYLINLIRAQLPPKPKTAILAAEPAAPHQASMPNKEANKKGAEKNTTPFVAFPIGSQTFRRHDIPDTRLANAFGYLTTTEWGRDHGADEGSIDREIRDKLHLDLLTAFGRVGERGSLNPIEVDIWESVSLNPQTGNAETEDGHVMYFDLQFSMKELRALWPTWHDTFGIR